MANATYNKKEVGLFPQIDSLSGKEKKRMMMSSSLVVADTSFSLTDKDGISHIRVVIGGAADVDVTLPKAANNTGRVLKFILGDNNTSYKINIVQNADGANIDGADATYALLDATDDQVELFCTGTEWIVVSQNIA